MKLSRRLFFSALSLALVAGLAGCHRKPKKVGLRNRSAATLLADGESALKQGRWEEGRRNLRLIEENMPSSPEYAKAKLLIGDSFFFAKKPSYPEAAVEYRNFLSYFPRHELRDYALYHIALSHFAAIENAERDQAETRLALTAFQDLVQQAPGSPYVFDAKAKIIQCWRRLAESELMVGIFYVNSRYYSGAEVRIKDMLVNYPEYADLERAYYYLGEAMRQKLVSSAQIEPLRKAFLARVGKDELKQLSGDEERELEKEIEAYKREAVQGYRREAREYYQKLVESYPRSEWTKKARKALSGMGSGNA
jgi:outer membrane protein assembly factor BamD